MRFLTSQRAQGSVEWILVATILIIVLFVVLIAIVNTLKLRLEEVHNEL